ncbi:heavy-metal-associated domain-containing protein [Pseudomonas sp. ABC1]|uniref:heavy-metal-associated domain-containing protein n=1 Tax=Pseudomonas sp. ABC1 TaxID=2748080 RepID=UPI0015C3DD06|nr:heavy metal-associated domain-containing protein [Pseudomonas sp. ABC1]QLF92518.1 heavy-metal-associated domain-containing protein [Pseudomonas sp. ABC1]
MSSITFEVQGMSCGGCSGKVKRALEALEGVSSTEVVLESGAVTVEYEAPATPESFRSTVEELGFDVAS